MHPLQPGGEGRTKCVLIFWVSKMKRESCERSVVTWSVWHAVWLLTYFPHVGQSGEMLLQKKKKKSLFLHVFSAPCSWQNPTFVLVIHIELNCTINLWSEPEMHGCREVLQLTHYAHWWEPEMLIFKYVSARRCLAFISPRCTGVWTAAASAGQSRQALASRTASGMRKTSGAALGKRHGWTRGVWKETFFFLCVISSQTVIVLQTEWNAIWRDL